MNDDSARFSASDTARTNPARKGWAVGLGTLAFLLVAVWGTSGERILPPPAPTTAPDTAFSSGRAMIDLWEMARDPRPLGSPEHARVRELIVERLEVIGLEPEVQTSLSLRRSGEAVRAVTLRNVLARIPGTASTGTIVLTAHYDAVPLSAGAGDDATGVVTILETVRAILEGPPLRNDVLVLITDGEEIGLLGARAFVDDHPWMDDVAVVLSFEMRGGGGPSFMFETGAENGWIVRAMQASDPRPAANSFSVEVYRRLPNDTDFTPFREVGVQGLNFAGIDRAWIYHQPTDVPANIQEATVQHKGERTLAITRELGGRDLSSVHAPDLVFTTLPVLGLVAYPLGWAVPISSVIVLLWLGGIALAVARGGHWTGVVAGAGVALATGVGAAVLGWALMAVLPRFHPEFGSMTPAFYGDGWYVGGLMAGVLALALVLLGVARRRFSLAELAAGTLTVPVVGAFLLAVAMPLAAIELQIPALAGALAVGLAALGGGRTRMAPTAGWLRIAAPLMAVPVLATMVPIIEGLWVAMSFVLAPVLGILAALALACLLPALDGAGEPDRKWAPLVAGAVGVLLVASGVIRAGPSADRPVHSTLLYALDREPVEALWATRVDPGFAWAEERAGPFVGEQSLERFLVPDAYLVASAPAIDLPLPSVRIGEADTDDALRSYPIEVTSEIGAELISVVIPSGTGARFVAVNGEPLPPSGEADAGGALSVTRVTHQGVPDGVLRLRLVIPSELDSLPLSVVEEHLRAAELLGEAPFRRPPHLMPSPRGRSDRALIRTPVTLP